MTSQIHRCVVRLKRSAYHDKKGVYFKESLLYLKRNSSGYNILEEEARNVGAMDAMPRNMSKMEEGIYEVKACNISRDWETGEVDGCDLELVPYNKS